MLATHSVLHVNECSVCAFPLLGNLEAHNAAASALDSELYGLFSCQLPSMPCTNYWSWIDLSLLLVRAVPRLIFLADHSHTHTHKHTQSRKQTGLYVVILKSRHHACLVGSSCPETQQTPFSSLFRLPFNLLQICHVNSNTHTSSDL